MNRCSLKKTIAILVSIFVMQCYPILGLSEDLVENKKGDLLEIQKSIDSISEKIKKNTEVKDLLEKELKKEEEKISGTKKELYKIKKKVNQNARNLSHLKKELSSLNKEIEGRKESLSQHFYRTYTEGEPSQIQMIIDGSNPNQVSRDIEYIRIYMMSQNENINLIKKQYKEIEKNKSKTDSTLKKIISLKETKEKNAKELIQQKKSKAKIIKKISAELESQTTIKQKLIDDEKKLSNLISDLIKESIAKAKKNNLQPNKETDKSDLPDQQFDGINFAKLKKKLRLPATGKVTHKFNSKRPDTGTKWKGIFISANEGDEVYAVAEGQIVFSDWLRGFGNIVIINHGSGYMSLYGNNQSLLKQTNEVVKGGDAIAIVGNSGGNNSDGVYYELRKNGTPFNPLSWTK
jgi:murein hydrolase activator